MKSHMEEVKQLRANVEHHYNCAQSLLVPFAEELHLTKDQAEALGAFFGSGMMHGSTCGVLSAAFMILGMHGYDKLDASVLLQEFRKKHHSTECADLLTAARDQGIPEKQHCDALVFEMTEFLDQTL